MNKDYKKTLITTIILILVNILFSGIVLLIKSDYTIRGFSDAFFISGAALLLMYILRALGAKGSFDFVAYTFIRFRDSYRKDAEKSFKDAYEYTEHKREERIKNKQNFLPYFIVPTIFIITAIILAFVAMQ